jgi:hypothetical protein
MIKIKYNFNHISPHNPTDPRQTKINTKNNRGTMNDYELWSEAY